MEDTRTEEQKAFQRASFRQITNIGCIPRMTRDERVQFVLNYVDNQIFTSIDIPHRQLGQLLPMVFMPVAFGMFDGWEQEDMKRVGCVWEYLSEAGPRGINGCPMFFSARLMHREDFLRCAKAIDAELDRRKQAAQDIDV